MISDQAQVRDRAAETARLLRALANPQRLLILCHLLQAGESSAGELARQVGLGQSALSQHLARMRVEGLVEYRRDARTLFYRIGDIHDGRLPALLQGVCAEESTQGEESMNRVHRTVAALGLAFASTAAMAGNGFWQTPVVTEAGRMHPLPNAAYQPDRAAMYKVVFALTHGSDKPGEVNPGLQRVARTVNLYASAGVPLDHMKFVAIASGPATNIALDDAHYENQYGVANPNLSVIRELRMDGVDIAVCGQAIAEHHYQYDWIDKSVTVALSALTTVTELQQKGYALMPL